MKVKYISILLATLLVVLGAADYLSAHINPNQIYLKDTKLPRSFRISPVKEATYYPIKVLYNPVEDLYIAFIMEWDYKAGQVYIYSRPYNHKGRPKGPYFKVLPMVYMIRDHAPTQYFIAWVDVCYNTAENRFFLIWTYQDMDGVYGTELNARGNREGINFNIHTMKKPLGKRGSGFYPQIVWMPGKDQYAMGFTYLDFDSHNMNSPKYGYYLSTFTPFLTPKKNMKKVKSLRDISDIKFLSDFKAAGNKLFWVTMEDIDGVWIRPAVWFTKSNGKNLSQVPAFDSGTRYPGKKFKYGGYASAGYNFKDDHMFVHWLVADADFSHDRNSQEIHYRIMDGDGNFISKEQKLPQAENFSGGSFVTYDSTDDHFFLVCAEYKVLSELDFSNPSPIRNNIPMRDNKYHWGGRLWGYQIDVQGKQIGSGIPLTKIFTNTDDSLYLDGAIYNSYDDQYFIFYDLDKHLYNAYNTSKAFGLIYK